MRGSSLPHPFHNAPLATPVASRVVFFAAIVADLDGPFSRLASSPRAILATPVVFRVVLSTAVLAHFDRPFPLLYHGPVGGADLRAALEASCKRASFYLLICLEGDLSVSPSLLFLFLAYGLFSVLGEGEAFG
jgi:hypothetical protein